MSEPVPWRDLLELTGAPERLRGSQRELLRSLLATVGQLAEPEVETLDLKIADSALKEMVEAFRVFRPYREVPKLTMFGSARTKSHDPVYLLARSLAQRMADDGWMVVTGAGPGIMQAGVEGAGADRSFGVNIKLPHEQGANPVIAFDPKLVEMRYFFTRKLILVKESAAYAVLPGGFGTLDELFELLTLLQTGKAVPAPVVLVETESGTYWHALEAFLEGQAISSGYVSAEDDTFWSIANTVEEAAEVFRRFYSNYHSLRTVGDLLVLRVRTLPSSAELVELNRRFGDILKGGTIAATEPLAAEVSSKDALELSRVALRFDLEHYGRLRQLIDALNECSGS